MKKFQKATKNVLSIALALSLVGGLIGQQANAAEPVPNYNAQILSSESSLVSQAYSDSLSDTTNIACVNASMPGGGLKASYNVNGTETMDIQPPKGFNPLTASDTQLAEYYFPARPKNKKLLQKWNDDYKEFFENENNSRSKIKISKNISCNLNKKSNMASATTNDFRNNWSGYITSARNNNRNVNFNCVAGEFKQPAINKDSPENSYECSWVGLGGDNVIGGQKKLIQCGTLCYKTPAQPNRYYMFFEYLTIDMPGCTKGHWDSGTVAVGNWVNPGDVMHFEVNFCGDHVVFTLWNKTTGDFHNCVIYGNIASYYDGSTAEAIDEAPSISGITSLLADFRNVNWAVGVSNWPRPVTKTGPDYYGTSPIDACFYYNNLPGNWCFLSPTALTMQKPNYDKPNAKPYAYSDGPVCSFFNDHFLLS